MICSLSALNGSDHYVLFCHDPLSWLDIMQLSYASPWVDPWDTPGEPTGTHCGIVQFGIFFLAWEVWRGSFPCATRLKKRLYKAANTKILSNTTSLIVRIHKRLNTFERERKKNSFSSLAVRRYRRWHGEKLMSVAQVRGQSNRCLKSPVANVTGVGRFSVCRCFLQPAHSLVRSQLYISSSDGIGSASHHLPSGHPIFGRFPPVF